MSTLHSITRILGKHLPNSSHLPPQTPAHALIIFYAFLSVAKALPFLPSSSVLISLVRLYVAHCSFGAASYFPSSCTRLYCTLMFHFCCSFSVTDNIPNLHLKSMVHRRSSTFALSSPLAIIQSASNMDLMAGHWTSIHAYKCAVVFSSISMRVTCVPIMSHWGDNESGVFYYILPYACTDLSAYHLPCGSRTVSVGVFEYV